MTPRKLFVFLFVAFLTTATAWAGNGHLLHGVGAVSSSMGGAGSTFQKHFCLGAGLAVMPRISANLGFYVVPNETASGPILSLYRDTIPLSQIDMSNSITSGQISMNFAF